MTLLFGLPFHKSTPLKRAEPKAAPIVTEIPPSTALYSFLAPVFTCTFCCKALSTPPIVAPYAAAPFNVVGDAARATLDSVLFSAVFAALRVAACATRDPPPVGAAKSTLRIAGIDS